MRYEIRQFRDRNHYDLWSKNSRSSSPILRTRVDLKPTQLAEFCHNNTRGADEPVFHFTPLGEPIVMQVESFVTQDVAIVK